MKKTLFFAAMAAVALSSCSNNEMEGPEVQGGSQLAKIQVGQTVQGIDTKAAISSGDQVEATIIATAGVAPTDWMTFTPVLINDFDEGVSWNSTEFANVATGTFVAGNDQSIVLNPSLYASTDDGATLTGVAPKGTVEYGKVTFSVQDAQQDVMTAATTALKPVNGGEIEPFSLTFNHRTAQLRFSFAATNTDGDAAWADADIKVKSVTVKKALVPTAVKLADMSLEWTTSAQNFLLNGFTNNVVPTTFGTTAADKPDFITVDKQALVKPGVAVELDVVLTVAGLDKAYTAIKPLKKGTMTTPLTTVEGRFHNISLIIKQPASPTGTPTIAATATVTEWGLGDEGTADL